MSTVVYIKERRQYLSAMIGVMRYCVQEQKTWDDLSQQKQIREQLPATEARLEELKSTANNVARFLENAKKYRQIDELTSEILRTFIQKVTIGERSKKHSKHATQEVKIYYRDVGLLDDMPEANEAEVTLVAEAQTTERVA